MYKVGSKRLINKCHTLQRFRCQDQWTEQQYKDEAKASSKADNAHLFYNSVKCASTLDGTFTKISLSFVILTILSLIL